MVFGGLANDGDGLIHMQGYAKPLGFFFGVRLARRLPPVAEDSYLDLDGQFGIFLLGFSPLLDLPHGRQPLKDITRAVLRLADAMKEKGLGTPATRASVIDHLIREKCMERDGRNLMPTTKAENLFEFLQAIKAAELTQPALTGDWEYQLRHMETGETTRETFMEAIKELTRSIVDKTKTFEEDPEAAPESTVISPTDKKPMKEMLRAFRSQDGELMIYKTISNRRFSQEEVQTLINDRVIGPLDDFRSKAGKPFSATLRLDAMNKVSFDFNGDGNGNGEKEEYNLEELPVVGVFKGSGSTVYETPKAYACSRTLQGEPGDNFRLSRIMLGKTIDKEEIVKLLEDGKTGLIKGFKSKRTGRLFDAFLILKTKGDIGFEFPPRKKVARKAAKKKS